MTHAVLTRLAIFWSLCALLLAPLAFAEGQHNSADGRDAFSTLGLTEDLVVQGNTDPQLIALQQDDAASGAATTDVAGAEEEADEQEVSESPDGWVEGSHRYAARKADEMTQWVDNFFGNDERDLEQAYSRLRLRTIYDWDDRLDNEVKVRLGGKVSLPQISDRLDLVFRGEDMDGFNDEITQ